MCFGLLTFESELIAGWCICNVFHVLHVQYSSANGDPNECQASIT